MLGRAVPPGRASTLRRAPALRFAPAGAEQGVSLPASPVDLLGEGLRAGVEGGVAAVDRPDGELARDARRSAVKRAWPLASSVTRATAVLPTKNVTVPVGVPVPEGSRTVAVNVTACPTRAGLADANRAVVVALRVVGAFTCSVRACELPTKFGRRCRPR